jgi:ABC-type Mn2+/Zn2+ transport system permease subunit
MEQLLKIMIAVFGVIVFILLFSLFGTFLWFCFDDKLAEIAGVPALGNIPWYNVWPATILISVLFKSSNTNNCNCKNSQ